MNSFLTLTCLALLPPNPKIETKRYRLHDVSVSPMPLQKPRPPLYVGGNSEAALRRVARFADGWHATATNRDAFQQSADTLRRFWKDAGRDGEPALSLRIPIVIEGVHQAAVDMALIRGRHVITGTVAKIAEELRGFRALGCGHIALEVSYSTYPAIHDTIRDWSDRRPTDDRDVRGAIPGRSRPHCGRSGPRFRRLRRRCPPLSGSGRGPRP